ERVARGLGACNALLLRGHGCVVVGGSVAATVMASIYLRDNAAIQTEAMRMGEPRYLSTEEARAASRVMGSGLVIERAWNYWVRRARQAMPDLAV
ncbi:MAG: class II aldolase/adducin family protein, partial [Deferrisomatales bacterium]|nr:class II aldolase/adducin family protein [Deferrisomatales bacterium]